MHGSRIGMFDGVRVTGTLCAASSRLLSTASCSSGFISRDLTRLQPPARYYEDVKIVRPTTLGAVPRLFNALYSNFQEEVVTERAEEAKQAAAEKREAASHAELYDRVVQRYKTVFGVRGMLSRTLPHLYSFIGLFRAGDMCVL